MLSQIAPDSVGDVFMKRSKGGRSITEERRTCEVGEREGSTSRSAVREHCEVGCEGKQKLLTQ